MEKELKAAKQFNKTAIVIILIMLILMSIMAINMQHLSQQYKRLELKYEQLYEEASCT